MSSDRVESSLPKVIIILLTYNRLGDMIECIDSLQRCTYPSMELLLVDNGSTNGTYEKLQKRYPRIAMISTGRNLGYTGGINIGLTHALKRTPQYVLILNEDTVVEPGFLEPMIEALHNHPNAAVACGTICCHHDRSRLWYAGGRLIPWRGLAVHDHKGKPTSVIRKHGPQKVSFVTGCMLLLRSSAIPDIGLEDERFFLYLDDIELSARIGMKGYELLYVPESIIYHKVLGERDSPRKLYYSVRNRLLLIESAFPSTKLIASAYYLAVIAAKMSVWVIKNPDFFKAARSGLTDYFKRQFGEGRGIALFPN